MNTESSIPTNGSTPPRKPRTWLRVLNLAALTLLHLSVALMALANAVTIYNYGEIPHPKLALAGGISGVLWLGAVVVMLLWWRSHPFRIWALPLLWFAIYFTVLVAVCPGCQWQEKRVGEEQHKATCQATYVGGNFQDVVVSEGSAWATDIQNNNVVRLAVDRLALDRVQATIPVGKGPVGIAASPGAIWVANSGEGTVDRIDPTTNQVVASIVLAGRPLLMTYGGGAVWVSNTAQQAVARIDPVTNKVVALITVGGGPSGVAFGEGSVWVTNFLSDTVSRIDPASNKVIRTLKVGTGPVFVQVGFGSVWVVNQNDSSVSRIDPRSASVLAVIPVGRVPLGLTMDDQDLWVSDSQDNELAAIDPARNQVVARIPVRPAPAGITFADGTLWSANYSGSISTCFLEAAVNP
jgi:YVTN family beta-propeller protein